MAVEGEQQHPQLERHACEQGGRQHGGPRTDRPQRKPHDDRVGDEGRQERCQLPDLAVVGQVMRQLHEPQRLIPGVVPERDQPVICDLARRHADDRRRCRVRTRIEAVEDPGQTREHDDDVRGRERDRNPDPAVRIDPGDRDQPVASSQPARR